MRRLLARSRGGLCSDRAAGVRWQPGVLIVDPGVAHRRRLLSAEIDAGGDDGCCRRQHRGAGRAGRKRPRGGGTRPGNAGRDVGAIISSRPILAAPTSRKGRRGQAQARSERRGGAARFLGRAAERHRAAAVSRAAAGRAAAGGAAGAGYVPGPLSGTTGCGGAHLQLRRRHPDRFSRCARRLIRLHSPWLRPRLQFARCSPHAHGMAQTQGAHCEGRLRAHRAPLEGTDPATCVRGPQG